MKRLMCLSFLFCLCVGVFSARGYSAATNILDVGTSDTDDALASAAVSGTNTKSSGWVVNTNYSTLLATANADTTLSIGSSSGSVVSGSLTTLNMGDIVLTAADTDQKFAHLLIGGFGADSTGPLADFPVAGAGQNFKAQFGAVRSEYTDGTLKYQPLSVLTGRTAVWVGINSLTGAKAMVEGNGDTAEGNTLKLDAMTLTAAGELSATALSSKAHLELGAVTNADSSANTLNYKATSAGDNEGRIIFTAGGSSHQTL